VSRTQGKGTVHGSAVVANSCECNRISSLMQHALGNVTGVAAKLTLDKLCKSMQAYQIILH